MNNLLVILGNGSFSREVTDLLDGKYDILGYCADMGDTQINLDEIPFPVNLICAIISPKRKNLIAKVPDENFINCICGNHSKDVDFGKGVITGRNTTISHGSKIGNHVIINRGATIGHDVTIGDYTTIGPGVNIAGNVTIGESVFIGIGANIIQNITIGDNAIIGAGSLIIADVEDNWKILGIHK